MQRNNSLSRLVAKLKISKKKKKKRQPHSGNRLTFSVQRMRQRMVVIPVCPELKGLCSLLAARLAESCVASISGHSFPCSPPLFCCCEHCIFLTGFPPYNENIIYLWL